MRTTKPITTKLGSNISLVMLITWLDFHDFGGILLENLYLPNFLYWTYLRNGCPIDVKRKGGALVGYWVNHVTLTFDLTHDLDLVVSRSKFEIALFEEWGADWHGTKGMWVDHSWPWLWPMGNQAGAAADRRTLLKPGAQLDLASPYAVASTGRTESSMSLNYAKLCVELNYTGAAIGEMWGDLAICHAVFE